MRRIACIVMPTYNEAANLPEPFPRIFDQAEKIATHELHVLIVYDNSPDGTASVVVQWMKDNPRIHLLSGEKKGLGEAYKRGIAHAIAALDPELILQMDADQQHDPNLLPLFVSLTQYGFTLVIGSRFASGAGEPALSFRRRLISRLGTILVRMVVGLPRMHDCTSGYRCILTDHHQMSFRVTPDPWLLVSIFVSFGTSSEWRSGCGNPRFVCSLRPWHVKVIFQRSDRIPYESWLAVA